jgi:phenylalanine-4-hydroxylase
VPFFSPAGRRKFPVTDWIRTAEEFDYIVEPDVFHDLFGHVPLLFNPVFADYVQRYGAGRPEGERLGACELLSRLYWYTIEFGLIRQPQGLRAYGAGILSVRPANCATRDQPRAAARGAGDWSAPCARATRSTASSRPTSSSTASSSCLT